MQADLGLEGGEEAAGAPSQGTGLPVPDGPEGIETFHVGLTVLGGDVERRIERGIFVVVLDGVVEHLRAVLSERSAGC